MTDMAEYMRNRRSTRRTALIKHKGGKCERCGSTDRLELDHRDRLTKTMTLSGSGLDGPWSRILDESDKCDLLCADCHLEHTREQYRGGEIRPWNDKTGTPHQCGTMRSYQEAACRCPLCREAKRRYRAKMVGYDEVLSPQV